MPGPSNSITSANALLFLSVTNLFTQAQRIQQYVRQALGHPERYERLSTVTRSWAPSGRASSR